MSEFNIVCVRIGAVEKHPNADTLSITKIHGGYPCIMRTGDFCEGDLAVYVPVDCNLPADDSRWAFMVEAWQKEHKGKTPPVAGIRVKAKRLRGIFSMGLLSKPEPNWVEGQDVRETLRITKYEPPEQMVTGGETEHDGSINGFPTYTDIEALRKYGDILVPGEEVVILEKLHGGNSRFLFSNNRLWCGSHNQIKKEAPDIVWWKVAARYDLAKKLAEFPDTVLFGEVLGVQDLKYGQSQGHVELALFDAMETKSHRYFDYDEFLALAKKLEVPVVPELYRGPWSDDLRSHAEGSTMFPGANHVREGFVVKPVKERWNDNVQRVVLKLHGETYLMRK